MGKGRQYYVNVETVDRCLGIPDLYAEQPWWNRLDCWSYEIEMKRKEDQRKCRIEDFKKNCDPMTLLQFEKLELETQILESRVRQSGAEEYLLADDAWKTARFNRLAIILASRDK